MNMWKILLWLLAILWKYWILSRAFEIAMMCYRDLYYELQPIDWVTGTIAFIGFSFIAVLPLLVLFSETVYPLSFVRKIKENSF